MINTSEKEIVLIDENKKIFKKEKNTIDRDLLKVRFDDVVKYNNMLNRLDYTGFNATDLDVLFGMITFVKESRLCSNEIQVPELRKKLKKNITYDKICDAAYKIYEKFEKIKIYNKEGIYQEIDFITFGGFWSKGHNGEPNATTGIELHEKAKKYFNNLKNEFTYFSLSEFIGIKGVYAKNLYRLLKQYRFSGEYKVKFSSFKKHCGISSKYKQSDVMNKIVYPAIKEVEKYFYNLKCENVYYKDSKVIKELVFSFLPQNHVSYFENNEELKNSARVFDKEDLMNEMITELELHNNRKTEKYKKMLAILLDFENKTEENQIKLIDTRKEKNKHKIIKVTELNTNIILPEHLTIEFDENTNNWIVKEKKVTNSVRKIEKTNENIKIEKKKEPKKTKKEQDKTHSKETVSTINHPPYVADKITEDYITTEFLNINQEVLQEEIIDRNNNPATKEQKNRPEPFTPPLNYIKEEELTQKQEDFLINKLCTTDGQKDFLEHCRKNSRKTFERILNENIEKYNSREEYLYNMIYVGNRYTNTFLDYIAFKNEHELKKIINKEIDNTDEFLKDYLNTGLKTTAKTEEEYNNFDFKEYEEINNSSIINKEILLEEPEIDLKQIESDPNYYRELGKMKLFLC